MKREWLKQTYPQGIGLGDIIKEYVDHKTNYTGLGDKENRLRIAELSLVLDYVFRFSATPTFPEKFDGSFTI